METLFIFPSEDRVYQFDFTNEDEIVSGETLVSAAVDKVSPVDVDLTIGAAVISGAKVQVRISGAVGGTKYHIRCVCVTDGSNTIEACGVLVCNEC